MEMVLGFHPSLPVAPGTEGVPWGFGAGVGPQPLKPLKLQTVTLAPPAQSCFLRPLSNPGSVMALTPYDGAYLPLGRCVDTGRKGSENRGCGGTVGEGHGLSTPRLGTELGSPRAGSWMIWCHSWGKVFWQLPWSCCRWSTPCLAPETQTLVLGRVGSEVGPFPLAGSAS